MPKDWFETKLTAIRNRLGINGFALVLALFFIGCALLYVKLETVQEYSGGGYEVMAANPFDFSQPNDFGFRRLTPTISYLIGLKGKLIIVTNLLFATALLFCVARYFARHSKQLIDSFFATAGFAFSLVTLTTIHYGACPDSTSYLAIFLMWWFRRTGWIFYALFFVGLLNRESVVFLLPWFAVLRWQERKSAVWWLLESVIGFGVTLAGYYFYHQWLAEQAAILFNVNYYTDLLSTKGLSQFWLMLHVHGVGLFSVLRLLWIFPILAAVEFAREKRKADLLGLAFILIGTYIQLVIAFDTSRMMTLCFMALPVSLAFLWQENRYNIRNWIGWAFLANLAMPTFFVLSARVEVWPPLWIHCLKTVMR